VVRNQVYEGRNNLYESIHDVNGVMDVVCDLRNVMDDLRHNANEFKDVVNGLLDFVREFICFTLNLFVSWLGSVIERISLAARLRNSVNEWLRTIHRNSAGERYLPRTATAALAMSSTVLGKMPSQKMPAMQTAMATLIGADSSMGVTSAAFLLQ
jgi:hypothetical protein